MKLKFQRWGDGNNTTLELEITTYGNGVIIFSEANMNDIEDRFKRDNVIKLSETDLRIALDLIEQVKQLT